jgi:CheY-specific phosphatase CheX
MLLEALDYQHSMIKPLCDVAVRGSHLTPEEVAALDKETAALPPAEREEAVRNRMRSLRQLETSWRSLAERGVFLVEALSKKGYLSLKELDRLCEEYRQATTKPEINLQEFLPNAPETREILESLIEIALDLFGHYTQQTPEILSITQSFGAIEPGSLAFAQTISGDISIRYVLLLPAPLVLFLASRILQAAAVAVDDVVRDAVSEFLNVVVGNTCTKFSMRNYNVRAAPPETMTLDAFLKGVPRKPIVVRARVPGGEFHLAYLA